MAKIPTEYAIGVKPVDGKKPQLASLQKLFFSNDARLLPARSVPRGAPSRSARRTPPVVGQWRESEGSFDA